MAEKNKIFNKENLFATLLGASSFKDWAKSETGKVVLEKISSRMFGIGPEDEALFRKAINHFLDEVLKLDRKTQVEERKNVEKKITQFLFDLEKNGYSTWWFRNVLATMRKGDAEEDNQAARTLASILEGSNFNEMVEIAGPDLIQKSYKKKLSEGWEIVVGNSGKLTLLYDKSKIKIGGFSSKAKADAKEGFSKGIKTGLIVLGIPVLIFIIILLYSV
jgi:hypothetical protein